MGALHEIPGMGLLHIFTKNKYSFGFSGECVRTKSNKIAHMRYLSLSHIIKVLYDIIFECNPNSYTPKLSG